MSSPDSAFLAEPVAGRVYATRRIVRSTDAAMDGRLRLDALARYLQTAAEDDLADSGLLESVIWLVRRCTVLIRTLPVMGERLAVRTFCTGTGPRWAERTTTLTGSEGGLVQARAVWAAATVADGRPTPLSAEFMKIYGNAANGRTVSARLALARPDQPYPSRDWPLRAADFDTAGHVNNAVHWAAVEDMVAGNRWLPSAAEMEYHRAILPGTKPLMVTRDDTAGQMMWLLDQDRVLAAARLHR
jgi:acyl-ACP thioesterase